VKPGRTTGEEVRAIRVDSGSPRDVLHDRFQHVAVMHDGPEHLSELLAPEIDAAVAQGEAVLVCVDPDATACMRGALQDPSRVTFLPATDRYSRPGAAMHALQRFLVEALADDLPAAWSIGTIPFDGTPLDRRWVRYERAVDRVLGHLPLRAVCTYDLNTVPHSARATAHTCHQSVLGTAHPVAPGIGDHHAPRQLAMAPTLEIEVTTTRDVRRQISATLAATLPAPRLDDVLLVATELSTNSMLHGAPPVTVRVWDTPEGVVLDVVDHGTAIVDPVADLRPLNGGAHGGYGLWLVGELADEITIDRRLDSNVVTAFFAAV
jgi:anti-sigma regulatory factor (Ser/Thr protein kinase)